jgi:putative MFS transporter
VWVLWACAYFITNGLNNWMPTLYSSVYHLSLAQSLRAGTLTNVAQVVILVGCPCWEPLRPTPSYLSLGW